MPKLRKISESEIGRVRTRRNGRWAYENPVMAGVREIITQPFYDSLTVAANAAFPAQTTLFQTPVGQAGRTYLQTNMTQAGILPAPQKFSTRALRLAVRNDAIPADLINFLYQTWLRLYVSEKPYFIGPSFLWTAGGGVTGFGALLGTASALVGNAVPGSEFLFTSNGVPDQRNIFALSRPIEIEQNEQFRLEINVGTAFNTTAAAAVDPLGTGLTIYAILDGELSRGVN
jgi:hypothetical protein